MSKIGIVTVVTNEKHNLKNFYDSLISQTYKDFTLYFVDNNSNDGSQEFFRELNNQNLLTVKYLTLDYNSGFAAGSNIGAKEAIKDGCKYLFILNNDVVIDSKCLEELRNCIESQNDIAASGLFLYRHQVNYPGIIQEFGGRMDFKNGRTLKNFENVSYDKVKLPDVMETDFIGGGVLFIKSDIFDKVGMFEECYFGYFDEIDLSYRLKVKNNYRMLVTSKAIAYHNHYSASRKKTSFYFEYYLSARNKYVYFYRYGMHFSIFKNILIDWIKLPWRWLWFIKVCDFKLGLYYIKGLFAGLLNHRGKPNFVK